MNGESHWTGYHRLLERYFFKGNGRTDASMPGVAAAEKSEFPPQPTAESGLGRNSRPPADKQSSLRVSLGEQLKGKNLNLFMNGDEEKD
jgi:3'-5' exoribonuclease